MGLDLFTKFDNAESFNYIPDNEHRCLPIDDKVMIPGGTCVHTFEFPYWISEEITDIEAIYTQGTDLCKFKYLSEMSVEETVDIWDHKWSKLKITLDPSFTSDFNYYNQDCNLQLKMLMKDGSLIYRDKIVLRIISTTDMMSL